MQCTINQCNVDVAKHFKSTIRSQALEIQTNNVNEKRSRNSQLTVLSDTLTKEL